MNLTSISPIKNIRLLIALSIVSLAVAGCGNKGSLVKPSDIPEAAPAASTMPPASAEPIVEPDSETPAEPVVTPAAGTPAAQR